MQLGDSEAFVLSRNSCESPLVKKEKTFSSHINHTINAALVYLRGKAKRHCDGRRQFGFFTLVPFLEGALATSLKVSPSEKVYLGALSPRHVFPSP